LAYQRNLQTIDYEDGSYYLGQLYKGNKHGNGILCAADGSVYLGEWENNDYHGMGIYFYPDG